MRDCVQRTPYGCVVRIGICLPDDATFSLDECVCDRVPLGNIMPIWRGQSNVGD
jgi:hypothetical protein